MQQRTKLPKTFLVFLALLPALTACPAKETAGDDEEKETERRVAVAKSERGDLLETVTLIGQLQGTEEVRVFAMVTDRIRRLAVREGDMVRSGQVLAVLASDMTSQAVEQAEAGLEAAAANRDALAREVERIRPLVEAGSAPRSQLETLETQLLAASAQVRQATAGRGQASVHQGRTVIRSPISGVVSGLMAQEGEISPPSMPLLTVVRPDLLKAVVRAPERHFLRMREGMAVTVSPIAGPHHEVRASVSLKGPVVDRMTRTGLVEVEIDNSEGKLVPGSMVRVVVEIEKKEDVVLVPAESVVFTVDTEETGRAWVFLAEGERARRKQIVVGTSRDGKIEVREGLSEGEWIVIRGAQFLRDGHPIRYDAQEQAEEARDGGPEGAEEISSTEPVEPAREAEASAGNGR
ncbi:MAG: efflux RND transporter periplasmic adaptor subunit [Myxococcota bacterium]